MKRVGVLALVLILSAGFSSHSDRITGKYKYYTGYDYHFIHVKGNHSYYKEKRGCTYGSVTKGKWSLTSDTLTLKRTHYKSRRSKNAFKSCILETERYLVRKDSLIELYRNDSGALVRMNILKRK